MTDKIEYKNGELNFTATRKGETLDVTVSDEYGTARLNLLPEEVEGLHELTKPRPREFKAGDKVRVTNLNGSKTHGFVGKEGVLAEYTHSLHYDWYLEPQHVALRKGEFELVTAVEDIPKPLMGTFVRKVSTVITTTVDGVVIGTVEGVGTVEETNEVQVDDLAKFETGDIWYRVGKIEGDKVRLRCLEATYGPYKIDRLVFKKG